jgi:hypothetical protein
MFISTTVEFWAEQLKTMTDPVRVSPAIYLAAEQYSIIDP